MNDIRTNALNIKKLLGSSLESVEDFEKIKLKILKSANAILRECPDQTSVSSYTHNGRLLNYYVYLDGGSREFLVEKREGSKTSFRCPRDLYLYFAKTIDAIVSSSLSSPLSNTPVQFVFKDVYDLCIDLFGNKTKSRITDTKARMVFRFFEHSFILRKAGIHYVFYPNEPKTLRTGVYVEKGLSAEDLALDEFEDLYRASKVAIAKRAVSL